ncbi:MAG TPA: endonuclease/exonuclease/phosphatase family protein [Solirubrobacterales bacterium]|nr:endonuclease/exonuclease/phosphatase family protein [Solirubrobacterales bacterium]
MAQAAITDKPPADTVKELAALSARLDEKVPRRTRNNLLVATWNIRKFGGLTDKWHSVKADRPKRDLHALACITEIVSRFDVVAIQEVQTEIRALRHMLKLLGSDFTVILTDAVEDHKGNNERLAFVFNKKRLEVSGLACELVVPLNWTKKRKPKAGIDRVALKRQFARTPYAVAFRRGNSTFILVTLHVFWGTGKQGIRARTAELTAIATWLRSWAEDTNSWDQNLICLGDFNIDKKDGKLWKAFTSTGLTTPSPIDQPRIVEDKPLKGFYDQISWFVDENDGRKSLISLDYTGKANVFDWSTTVLAKSGMSKTDKSHRISDHYPLWVEFALPKS